MTWIVITVIVIVALIILTVILSITAHQRRVESGESSLIGKIGTAKTDIAPEGKFYVYGEYWDAKARGEHLKADDKGRVVEIKSGVEKYLIVEKTVDD